MDARRTLATNAGTIARYFDPMTSSKGMNSFAQGRPYDPPPKHGTVGHL